MKNADRVDIVRRQLEQTASTCKRNIGVPQCMSKTDEERRYFGYMCGQLERARHGVHLSDWLALADTLGWEIPQTRHPVGIKSVRLPYP